MAALPPYIPPRDVDLDTWSANFSTLLTASPATYGLTAADATAVAAVVASWHAAYLLVTSPTTKTATTVSAKNVARILMLATVRPYSIQISLNAGVSPSNKVAIGVSPRTSVPVPIPAPVTAPSVTINTALPLQHVLRYRDELSSPTVKAKPYGAIGIQIFGAASATVISSPDSLLYLATDTKSPLLVTWDEAQKGKTAYYAARWVTRRGLVGPWSPIITFTIAA